MDSFHRTPNAKATPGFSLAHKKGCMFNAHSEKVTLLICATADANVTLLICASADANVTLLICATADANVTLLICATADASVTLLICATADMLETLVFQRSPSATRGTPGLKPHSQTVKPVQGDASSVATGLWL